MNMLSPGDLRPFRLRIEDYALLDRAGVFAAQRVELIEGVIVAVNAEYRAHTRVKNELMFRLRLALTAAGLPFEAVVEPTLALPPHNLPEPDILVTAIAAASGDGYFQRDEAAIVIEVGATTLRGDLGVKRAMYAEQGIPEYWVVDVAGHQVHQFWAPADDVFAATRIVPLDGPLHSATIAGLTVDGGGIL